MRRFTCITLSASLLFGQFSFAQGSISGGTGSLRRASVRDVTLLKTTKELATGSYLFSDGKSVAYTPAIMGYKNEFADIAKKEYSSGKLVCNLKLFTSEYSKWDEGETATVPRGSELYITWRFDGSPIGSSLVQAGSDVKIRDEWLVTRMSCFQKENAHRPKYMTHEGDVGVDIMPNAEKAFGGYINFVDPFSILSEKYSNE